MKFKNYVSEFTKFLNDLKDKNPHIDIEQQLGRKLLWDKKPIDLNDAEIDKLSNVRQKPYVYSSN